MKITARVYPTFVTELDVSILGGLTEANIENDARKQVEDTLKRFGSQFSVDKLTFKFDPETDIPVYITRDEVEIPVERLTKMAQALSDSLKFAAPELVQEKIVQVLAHAYNMGVAQE